MTSKIEDVLSSLYKEEDRGIFNLIMSSVLLSIANTRIDLHKLTARTLLSVQQNRLGLKVKDITDKAISALIKKGVLKVKEKKEANNDSKDITVIIPSQDHVSTFRSEEVKKVVIFPDTELELSLLGRAAMKGSYICIYKFIYFKRDSEFPTSYFKLFLNVNFVLKLLFVKQRIICFIYFSLYRFASITYFIR